MSQNGFVKLQRSEELDELLKRYPNAFLLLTMIALRARREIETNSINGVKQCEALIGDYRNIGMSERGYRTAKSRLAKCGIVTFKATNRGTIAKLVDKRFYDINEETTDEQSDRQVTNKATGKRRTGDGQVTTKEEERSKEVKKEEEKETADKPPSFPSDSKEYKYAQRFFERLQEINPTIKKPNLSRWAADFDLLLRVDKRDEQQLGKVVSYALTGFWRGKIMSPKKLREKYDTLTTQMLTDTDKQGKPTAAGLAAGDTELEVRTTLTGREYVVTKDTPESFIPPEYMQKFHLVPSEWQKKTDDGSLFFFLKDWYAKNGKGTTDFEIKYCNTPTHD